MPDTTVQTVRSADCSFQGPQSCPFTTTMTSRIISCMSPDEAVFCHCCLACWRAFIPGMSGGRTSFWFSPPLPAPLPSTVNSTSTPSNTSFTCMRNTCSTTRHQAFTPGMSGGRTFCGTRHLSATTTVIPLSTRHPCPRTSQSPVRAALTSQHNLASCFIPSQA